MSSLMLLYRAPPHPQTHLDKVTRLYDCRAAQYGCPPLIIRLSRPKLLVIIGLLIVGLWGRREGAEQPCINRRM